MEATDGPFATARQHLGGDCIVEVPDLGAALAYAAMPPPAAVWGTVEMRPLMDYNPAG